MKFVTHMFMLGDTIHGIIRRYNRHNMTQAQVLEMMVSFNEQNGRRVPKVGEAFEIPQWEEHEVPAEPETTAVPATALESFVEHVPSLPSPLPKIQSEIVVETEDDAAMISRQLRRENARRAKQGLPPKKPTTVKVAEKEIATSKNSLPKNPPDEIVNANGLPVHREKVDIHHLVEKEQEVLRRALEKSVVVIDKGKMVEAPPKQPPVEPTVEIEDTKPATPTNEEIIAEKRRLARERRQQQLNKKKTR